VDLHRWLGGQYAIPAVEPPDFEDMGGGQDTQPGKPNDDE
jgi:endogenous inhibitor of DNA gyrase (YacG/DUF329 family)